MLRPLLHCLLVGAAIVSAAEAAQATALEGCWRTQQMEIHFRNGGTTQTNQDCVSLFDAGHVRSSCYLKAGSVTTNSDYAPLDNDHIHVSLRASSDGKIPAYEGELQYSIDGKWLTTIVEPKGAPGDQRLVPTKLIRLSRKVEGAEGQACEPRGASPLDWGKLPIPQSAYKFDPPAPFVPYLEFGSPGLNLEKSGMDSLFVGAYSTMPRDFQKTGDGYVILMLEYSLSGPKVLRESEFKTLMRSVENKVGAAALILEDSQRSYFDIQQIVAPEAGISNISGVIAFHNISGRMFVSFVIARGIQRDVARKKMVAIADEFAAGLEKANP